MYTCLTLNAKKDNYNYASTAYNYEGSTVGRNTVDDDDGDIAAIYTGDSSFLRTNLALFMAICLLLILN
jgi:hypothetical protein